MRIISASVNTVNIDEDIQWCTYNIITGEKKIIPKKAWPTYEISLTAYRNYYPIDPPIEIDSPEDIDEGLVLKIRDRVALFKVSKKTA